MGEIVAEIMLVSILIAAGLTVSAVALLIDLLKRAGRYSMETLKPEIERMWEEYQRKRLEARKPADIQDAARDARIMVDRILADYRQETGEILQTPWPNDNLKQQYLEKVIFIDHHNS